MSLTAQFLHQAVESTLDKSHPTLRVFSHSPERAGLSPRPVVGLDRVRLVDQPSL
jgi:hypothetical protein